METKTEIMLDALKAKPVLTDVAVSGAGLTIFGLTGAEWLAIGGALLMLMRLGLTVWDVIDRIKNTKTERKGES